MRKKVKLDKANGFEEYVVAFQMADMLANFLRGDLYPSAIGSEQGIPTWDDIIIWFSDGRSHHFQVKRQAADFSPSDPVRRDKQKGNNKGDPQGLSPLDKTIQALGEAYKDPESPDDCIFTLSVITNTNIKSNISVSHFQDLCNDCANKTVNKAGLEERARTDNPTKGLFDWLTTWCGFKDWDHIVRSLSRLTISYAENEQDIENKSEDLLKPFFTNPKKVISEIRYFFHDNGNDASATTPRTLLNHLKDFIKPDFSKWTAYRRDDIRNEWGISGIHCLEDIEVEKAVPVVSGLWSRTGEGKSLRIEGDFQFGSNPPSLPTALIRLGLHFSSPAQMMIKGKDKWISSASNLCGGTLGADLNEFSNMQWLELQHDLAHVNERVLSTTSEQDEEANNLLQAMDDQTWELICIRLGELITAEPQQETRDVVEKLWISWRDKLNVDKDERSDFLTGMMSIASESRDINSRVRVGPQTINILADAIKLNLIIVAALSDGEGRWDICDGRGVKAISLKFWGGPGTDSKGVRQLDEDDLSVILGNEPSPIVIMSGVECSSSDFLDESMGTDAYSDNSLMSGKAPRLLVTNSRRIRLLIRDKSFTEIQDYFLDKLKVRVQAHDKAVEKLVRNT